MTPKVANRSDGSRPNCTPKSLSKKTTKYARGDIWPVDVRMVSIMPPAENETFGIVPFSALVGKDDELNVDILAMGVLKMGRRLTLLNELSSFLKWIAKH
jgi:hypothetical protein